MALRRIIASKKRRPRPPVDADGGQDVGGVRRMDLPVGQVGDDLLGRRDLERLGDLASRDPEELL